MFKLSTCVLIQYYSIFASIRVNKKWKQGQISLSVKEKVSFSLVCAATWFANEVREMWQEN